MNLPSRRSGTFTAAMVLVLAATAPTALAQSPITVVSPHAGESVDNWRPYIVRWTADAIPGIAGFNVYAIGASGETEQICTAAAADRACEWWEPFLGDGSVRVVIEARDGSERILASAESGQFQLEDQGLGAEWISQDFGDVGRSGGARGNGLANGAQPVEVRGAGGDIWGTADAFHYTFREMPPGDFDASATITAIEGTEAWTKVGLMIRHEYSRGSPHHFVLASRGKGLAYQRRLTENGETLHTTLGTSSALPAHVEAMRRNDYVVMNVKQGDGPWREAAVLEGEGMLLLGLAVTSHDRSVLATGRFAGVNADSNFQPDVEILKPDAFQELPVGQPFTIEWTQRQPMYAATVSYSLDSGRTWAVVPGCESIVANACLWTDPGPEAERARIRVVVHDPGNRRAVGVTYPFSIRADPVTPLPEGWDSGDVGAVSAAGAASYAPETGRFIVEGSGADIWGAADEFHFVSRLVSTSGQDLEIVARVDSVQNVNRWTKVGLMVRADRGAGAPHASIFATPTAEKGIAFQRRRTQGAASVHTAGPAVTAPVWLKLIVRRGGIVRAYYRSHASSAWTFVGEDTIALDQPGGFVAGLAVSSHVDGRLARASFADVTVGRIPQFDEQDIGAVGLAGSTRATDLTVTMEGSGADIWGTADAFRFRYARPGSRPAISARVRSIENTHSWAKAGVMLRDDLSPGSPHVMLIVSPGKGIAMQYRAAHGGPSANVAIVPGAAPEWLRLRRDDDGVVGEASEDGTRWRVIGRLASRVGGYVGLAVTSHNNSTLATAVFEDVRIQF